MPYLLYGHHTSGHSYKVALTLRLLGVDYDYRCVDLGLDRGERAAEWRRVSRFGEVPVLVGPFGALNQSNAILLKLSRLHPSAFWDRREDELATWLFWEANRVGYSLPNYRVSLRERGAEDPLTRALRARLLSDLEVLEASLDKEDRFILGPRISVADIACAAYLLMEDNPLPLDRWPRVAAWLDCIRSLPGSVSPKRAMPSRLV